VHVTQLPPPEPHAELVFPATQEPLLMHPVQPPTQLPLVQLAPIEHVLQVAPPVPHAEVVVPATHAPLLKQPAQSVQVPLMQL
jgi:hypothetical protein